MSILSDIAQKQLEANAKRYLFLREDADRATYLANEASDTCHAEWPFRDALDDLIDMEMKKDKP